MYCLSTKCTSSKVFVLIVLKNENTELRTTLAYNGFVTYRLASTILIGRVLCLKSPRIPPTTKTATSTILITEYPKYGNKLFGLHSVMLTLRYKYTQKAISTKEIGTKGFCTNEIQKTLNKLFSFSATEITAEVRRLLLNR